MKVCISGPNGFVGSHLIEFLQKLDNNIEITGICRWRSNKENFIDAKQNFQLFDADLLDLGSLIRILEYIKPDIIFHLAAQSYVVSSFNYPVQTITTNIIGTVNLLEAIRILKLDPIVHICGSSEVYGMVDKKYVPIREDCPFNPSSPYAVGKVGEDMAALQYFNSYSIKTIRTRAFSHSCSRGTPILLKDGRVEKGLIDIKYISEIRSPMKKGGYLSGELLDNGTQIWNMERHNLEVWNDRKWTKIKHISCHPIRESKLLEINAMSGIVEVTDNHSMISENGEIISAKDLKVGDKVKFTNFPIIETTFVPEDLAWLYGFFVAEGCVTCGKMRIDNKDISKLEKCKSILLEYMAIDSVINSSDDGMYRLNIRKSFEIAKRFYSDCYASDKNKKIPKIILNAKKEIKLAFLRGYNEGDGYKNPKVKSEFFRFTTKSPILAMGLCFLVENCLNVRYRVDVEYRDGKRYFFIRLLSQTETNNGKELIKNDNEVKKITELEYEGEVWDFETENHWFNAGIGGIVIHNTGPRRGEVFAASAFAKQLAAIKLRLQENKIFVGNLDSVRTFSDVRDTVRAYWLAATLGAAGEVYNIGGIQTIKIGDLLNRLFQISRLNPKIQVVEKLIRPSDVTSQIPCVEKFTKQTGWKPEIPLEETLTDLYNYWLIQLKQNPWKLKGIIDSI